VANKKELSKKLSKRTFLNQKESSMIIDELFRIITNEIKSGDGEVTIVGFGKFYSYEHVERPVRNPRTQEEMTLKSYKSLRFKASNVIKKLLKEESISEE